MELVIYIKIYINMQPNCLLGSNLEQWSSSLFFWGQQKISKANSDDEPYPKCRISLFFITLKPACSLGLLPTVVSLEFSSCKVCFGPVSMSQLHREAPSRLYLLPSSVDGDRERLLGGGQRVGDLGDGFLPWAGQAFRSADTHHAGGGKTRLGNVTDDSLLLRR